jgi:hypothetical protein
MTRQERYELMKAEASVDPNEVIEYPPIAISYGSYKTREDEFRTPIGTYGNFSFVQAPPKSKKTFFISMLAGAYLAGRTNITGDIQGHRDGKWLAHIDTEQGRFHAQKVFKRVLDIAGCCNADYDTYALRSYSAESRINFIDMYLKENADNVGVLIIDGIADLVSDVNDIRESNDIVQKVMYWTETYNIHIVVVIHSNFNSDKPTGHLGSFLEKKTETQIQLKVREDNEDIVEVICKRSRSYPFETFSFEVDKFGTPKIIDKIDDILDLGAPF